jgi:hypothetical protein
MEENHGKLLKQQDKWRNSMVYGRYDYSQGVYNQFITIVIIVMRDTELIIMG